MKKLMTIATSIYLALAGMGIAQVQVPALCQSEPMPALEFETLAGESFGEAHMVGFWEGNMDNETAGEEGYTIHVYTNIETGSWTMVLGFMIFDDPAVCLLAGGYGPMFSYLDDAYDIVTGDRL